KRDALKFSELPILFVAIPAALVTEIASCFVAGPTKFNAYSLFDITSITFIDLGVFGEFQAFG
ncbi:unnamed protein product, partial [Rotaria sp. Silwood2]